MFANFFKIYQKQISWMHAVNFTPKVHNKAIFFVGAVHL